MVLFIVFFFNVEENRRKAEKIKIKWISDSYESRKYLKWVSRT